MHQQETLTSVAGQPTREILNMLTKTLRDTVSELHAHLRKCLGREGNDQVGRPSQAYLRRQQQLDKAHELFRAAEARIELLVQHFGGSM